MQNYSGYGEPMVRTGYTPPDPSTQVSTQDSSKGEVSIQAVQKNVDKALAAAGKGRAPAAAIYLARASAVLNRKSAQGYGLAEYIQQARAQVQELLAAHAAAQGGGGDPYVEDPAYTEEYIEEEPTGMSTGAKLAIGGLVAAFLAAGVVAATR
jgi:hypothetical protein